MSNWTNLKVGKEESILVFEVKSMSILLCNISKAESNIFLRKLMLRCAVISLSEFFDLMC